MKLMKNACMMIVAMTALVNASALDFSETLKEIHAPADAKVVKAEFSFTNHTDKPVQIVKYDAACSCMAIRVKDGKLHYAPGESGVLRADFSMGNFSGTVDKIVALWLDKDPADQPSVKLTVRVHIPVLVSLEPKTLSWLLNGENAPQTMRITMNHDSPIRVVSVTSSSPAFRHELKTIEEGKLYELVVWPNDIRTPALGILRLETDCSLEQHRLQQGFAVVRKSAPAAAAKP